MANYIISYSSEKFDCPNYELYILSKHSHQIFELNNQFFSQKTCGGVSMEAESSLNHFSDIIPNPRLLHL